MEPVIADLVGPGMAVLFCGINPGLRSAAAGLHFAGAGNRFWKVLAGAGFTDRVWAPEEQHRLSGMGIGITNLVGRASASAAELSAAELRAGGEVLATKVAGWRPAHVAFVGMQAYRKAFRRPRASIGRQDLTLTGAGVWVLPNPSGLQARYQLGEMIVAFAELRAAAFGAGTGTESGIPTNSRRSLRR